MTIPMGHHETRPILLSRDGQFLDLPVLPGPPPPRTLQIKVPALIPSPASSSTESPSGSGSTLTSSHPPSPSPNPSEHDHPSKVVFAFPPAPTAIRFAPLPPLSPTRRRSTTPMGVAGRSALMRQRRLRRQHEREEAEARDGRTFRDEEIKETTQTQCWEDDGQGGRRLVVVTVTTTRTIRVPVEMEYAHDQIDDPFMALGKLVKGASRVLWKNMSGKKKQSPSTSPKSSNELEPKEHILTIQPQEPEEETIDSDEQDAEDAWETSSEGGGSAEEPSPHESDAQDEIMEESPQPSALIIDVTRPLDEHN